MQVNEHIHALKIPFQVPLTAEIKIDRFAYVYLLIGKRIHLIDSGVTGSAELIFEYIRSLGRQPDEIDHLIFTHTHPDHIGSAKTVRAQTGCTVIVHAAEREWIENPESQFTERPVPGFYTLIEGGATIDRTVEDGGSIELESGLSCAVYHTPGHSRGSVSLQLKNAGALFTGDALIYPGDMPIYDDIKTSLATIARLEKIADIKCLFSSWEDPISEQEKIAVRMNQSRDYLLRIHAAVSACHEENPTAELPDLCRQVVAELGLPPLAANPLVARALASSLTSGKPLNISS